jgi:hypothetical protein
MEYKHKIDIERLKQLRKLTEMSQEAGFLRRIGGCNGSFSCRFGCLRAF